MRFATSSVAMLGVKLGASWLALKVLPAAVAYALVHLLVLLGSYYLHTTLSFNTDLTWRGFLHFTGVVAALKAVDYLTFVVAFSFFRLPALWSVVIATTVLFVLRYALLRAALSGKPDP